MLFKWFKCSTYRNIEIKIKGSLVEEPSVIYSDIDCDVWNYIKNSSNNETWYAESEVKKVLNLDSKYSDIKKNDKVTIWNESFRIIDFIAHPDYLWQIENYEIFLKEI